jgi:ATP-binding cassette subfamily F protein uup
LEWLKRGAKARTTKAKGRIQEAGRLVSELSELTTRNAQGAALSIDFASSERKTRKLLTAKSISKSLGGQPLFKDLSFTLTPGMKLGLLGPNGSGKTTLIRLLTGELECDGGQIERATSLRIVHFDQAREQLDRSLTLAEALAPGSQTVAYRGKTMHITAWTAQFLFTKDQLDMPLSELSGGEQSRVLIARLMLRPADLLILDEPTNDLDIPSLEVLEESLADFPGALLLVTHDRFMLDRVSSELLCLDGRGGARLFADVAQWQRAQEKSGREEKAANRPAPKPAAPKANTRRLTWSQQREWEQMDAKIVQAEADLQQCHQEMEDPAVMADHVKLADACRRFQTAQEAVERLYARWQELEKFSQPNAAIPPAPPTARSRSTPTS